MYNVGSVFSSYVKTTGGGESVKLISSKLTSHVSLEQFHHKPIEMCAGGPHSDGKTPRTQGL